MVKGCIREGTKWKETKKRGKAIEKRSTRVGGGPTFFLSLNSSPNSTPHTHYYYYFY